MAKKKTQGKKHKFKYVEPTSNLGTVAPQANAGISDGAQSRIRQVAAVGGAPSRDFSYVGRDLRRISILLLSLVVLELVLWYLFSHTGLGNAVYNLVQA
jgi:hypothetical protein